MTWDRDKTLLLIQVFRDRRELWDPRCELFKSRKKRDEAWADLSERLDTPAEVLERKMQKLIVLFDLETDKRKATPKSGFDQEWCFYRPLLFLRDRNVGVVSVKRVETYEDNVIEKAKVWDWVLLMAGLVTGLVWQLVEPYSYSQQDSTLSQAAATMNQYTEDAQMTYPPHSLDCTENHSWIQLEVSPENSCLQNKHFLSLQNNTHNSPPHNNSLDRNVTFFERYNGETTSCLPLKNLPPVREETTLSQPQPLLSSSNATSAVPKMEKILVQEHRANELLHRQKRLNKSLANLTNEKMKNLVPKEE